MSEPVRVFVSYASPDRAFAERLVNDLQAAGAEVWWDVTDIDEGDFLGKINRALQQCQWLVLVLTPNAAASKWVNIEVNAAIHRREIGLMRGVLPVLASPITQDIIPPVWANLHRYDGVENYSNEVARLIRTLGLSNTPAELAHAPRAIPATPLAPAASPDRYAPLVTIDDKKPYSALPFDRRPVDDYFIEDLDQRLVHALLDAELAQRALAIAGRPRASVQDHMELLGLVVQGTPTVGAFMCLAPSRLLVNRYPACSLQMVVYDNVSRGESRVGIQPYQDNLLKLFDFGMTFLREDAGLRRIGVVGSRSRDDLELPEVALRDALANALIHRDYETLVMQNEPTRVEVFPDRVEVTSYGTLASGMGIDTLNQDIELRNPLRRNRVIADIFMIMRYAELNGAGVNRMRKLARDAGLSEPEITYGDSYMPSIRVTFTRPRMWASAPPPE